MWFIKSDQSRKEKIDLGVSCSSDSRSGTIQIAVLSFSRDDFIGEKKRGKRLKFECCGWAPPVESLPKYLDSSNLAHELNLVTTTLF